MEVIGRYCFVNYGAMRGCTLILGARLLREVGYENQNKSVVLEFASYYVCGV